MKTLKNTLWIIASLVLAAPPAMADDDKKTQDHEADKEVVSNVLSLRTEGFNDIGFGTGFGAITTNNFTDVTSISWKIHGIFFWKHAGLSPYFMIDRGRDFDSLGTRLHIATGLNAMFRFLYEGMWQPYVLVGGGLHSITGDGSDQTSWGMSAGAGLLIKVQEYVAVQLESFAQIHLTRSGGAVPGGSNLGDVMLVSHLGIAFTF